MPGVPLSRHLAAFAAVALAVVLAYGPALRGEFQFDDAMGIERGGWLLPQGKEFPALFDTLTHGWSSRGLVTATYQLNYWMAGGNESRQQSLNAVGDVARMTAPFHAFNIAFHIGVTGALYALLAWIARRLGRPSWLAPALGAALFGLHPLAAESVAYISARTGTMAACFGFWGIAGFVICRSRVAASALLLAGAGLAVGCKETGWMIPWMGLGALAWGYQGDLRALRRDWGPAFLAGGGLCAVAMLFWLQGRRLLGSGFLAQYAAFYGRPPLEAAVSHAATQIHLWWTTQLPRGLFPFGPWHNSVDLDPPLLKRLSDGALLRLFLELAALTAPALWAWRHRRSPAALGLLWIALGVVPVSVAALLDLTTERHAYMPLAGAVLVLSPALLGLARRRGLLLGAALLALLGLGRLTRERAAQWATEEALWAAAIRDAPKKARPYYNLAKSRVQKSLKLAAGDPPAAQALGKMAERGLRMSLRVSSTFHLAHGALGRELERQGRLDEAVAEYRLAILCHAGAFRNGEAPDLHAGQVTALTVALGDCLKRLGRNQEAVADFNQAIFLHQQAWQAGMSPPFHQEQEAALIWTLAKLHWEGGRAAQARQVIRDGLAVLPGSALLLEMQRALASAPAPP